MIVPIVREPDPILRQKAQRVEKITPPIQALIETMIETMHSAGGVGLAAHQVGSPLDVLVASPDGKKGKELVLINAEIVSTGGGDSSSEGCLSLPGISSEVRRASRVKVTGLAPSGESVTIEAQGLLAKILQHEMDHLKGILFIDRLGWLRRRRLLKQYRRLTATLNQVKL